jgi:hypothetical protein
VEAKPSFAKKAGELALTALFGKVVLICVAWLVGNVALWAAVYEFSVKTGMWTPTKEWTTHQVILFLATSLLFLAASLYVAISEVERRWRNRREGGEPVSAAEWYGWDE